MVTVVARSSGTTSAAGTWRANCSTDRAGPASPEARVSSWAIPLADWGLRVRSRSVAPATASSSALGTPGTTEETAGIVPDRCWYAMANEVSPVNGGDPVSSSNITTPSAYRSVRGSAGSPWICSGARYWTVPVTVPSAWLM